MPSILRLERNDDGALDLYLPAGTDRLEVLAEPQATVQRLRDALLIALGDWFLDETVGLDSEVAFGMRGRDPAPGYPLIPPEVEIRRVLSAVPGVRAIRELEVRALQSEIAAEAAGPEALALYRRVGGRAYLVTAKILADGGDLELVAPVSLVPSGF